MHRFLLGIWHCLVTSAEWILWYRSTNIEFSELCVLDSWRYDSFKCLDSWRYDSFECLETWWYVSLASLDMWRYGSLESWTVHDCLVFSDLLLYLRSRPAWLSFHEVLDLQFFCLSPRSHFCLKDVNGLAEILFVPSLFFNHDTILLYLVCGLVALFRLLGSYTWCYCFFELLQDRLIIFLLIKFRREYNDTRVEFVIEFFIC